MIENTVRQLMEKLKAKIFDNRGTTLIELLLTLSISAILLPVTYGAMITGYKIYEKVSIDAQLREDADYVSAMVMKKLYSYPFDTIEECVPASTTCVKFINSSALSVASYSGKSFYQVEDEEIVNDEQILQLVQIGEKKQWSFDGEIITTPSDFTGSVITSTCTSKPCNEAIIQLSYKVSHPNFDKTLNLESSFGF
ncbi:prepilin-type N-terminal cleavage/methylation domain-containing protein [Rossellomorea aquimaris]|uniref:Prepilin-type N-terminal cleavage/methylation domain-containing protein n=1 Tax=Rossellomorea aquimaris TaxID=189382 RepID=A0A5D4UI58_9BACI|nr:prepilin-type N-terminal cleavage/methylation domain-containing protein [Rossellomorea aquimaris]TYS77820.1 prepilin-type N-terminal cleavage/methylation domain-containing protein [Rossellomorea aquimaris]TYS87002.1 prepilin-type N-terminal cleavage/methylation domain-containing protein [Rossellomorea aquimaris]